MKNKRHLLVPLVCAAALLFGCGGGAASSEESTRAMPETAEETAAPTEQPTAEPTEQPTAAPTATPTAEPTAVPAEAATAEPAPAQTAAEATADPGQAKNGASAWMTYSITAELTEDNSIGSEWSAQYWINGTDTAQLNQLISVTEGEEIAFEAELTEADTKPDEGRNAVSHVVTAEELKDGFTLQIEVRVMENAGRNSGHVDTWTVTVVFTPSAGK